jgi:Ca2+-binding RTX toxin-like protein
LNGNDILLGALGNDNIYGGLPTNVPLDPSADRDLLLGGAGNDFLNGGDAADTATLLGETTHSTNIVMNCQESPHF